MDFSLPKLQKLLAKIPKGKVVTYAELARALGSAKAARAAGTLCGRNPEPDKYPCFKVVRSNGEIGHYGLGSKEKIRRLQQEGIEIHNGRIRNLSKYCYRFSS